MERSKNGRGKSITFTAWVWFDGANGQMHLTTNDPDPGAAGFHVAINSDPKKPGGHPYLFRELAKCLRSKGAPAPVEDDELVET